MSAKVVQDTGFDGPDPSEHSAGTSRSPKRIQEFSLVELLTPGVDGKIDFSRLANVPNEIEVRLNLGKLEQINAYNRVFQVRKPELRGKVPGTEHEVPNIHLFTNSEFTRLREEMSVPQCEDDLRRILSVAAHLDRNTGDIDVRLRQALTDVPPEHMQLSGGELKQVLATLYHELRHAGGEGEFLAYLHQERALREMEAPGKRRTDLEIMRFIAERYGDTAVADAIEEFQELVTDPHFPEVRDESFRSFMNDQQKKMEREMAAWPEDPAGFAGDLSEFWERSDADEY